MNRSRRRPSRWGTNLATAGWLRQHYGARAATFGLGALVLSSWSLGVLLETSGVPVRSMVELRHAHGHGPLAVVALTLMLGLAAWGVWHVGLRGWLGALGESLGRPHGHGHGHGHGH